MALRIAAHTISVLLVISMGPNRLALPTSKNGAIEVSNKSEGIAPVPESVKVSAPNATTNSTVGIIAHQPAENENINRTSQHLLVQDKGKTKTNRTMKFVLTLPPSPDLPEIPMFERKANLTGPDDPYASIPIQRLRYEDITYFKNSTGQNLLVGSGSFGNVYMAMYKETHPVIVKILHKESSKNTTKKRVIQLFHEARLSTFLRPMGLIPKFYGLVRTDIEQEVELGYVQEYYASGMTAYKLFREGIDAKEGNTEQPDWLDIFLQMVKSIQYLHELDILFNDLKLANVMVDISGRGTEVKLIDVGSATYRRQHTYRVHPPEDFSRFHHLDPEVLSGVPTSRSSDVYSICRIMSQVLARTNTSIPGREELRRYVKYCLQADRSDRPSTQDIIDKLHRVISATTDSTLKKILDKKDELEFSHKEFLFGLTLSPFVLLAAVVVKGMYYRRYHRPVKPHSL